MDKVIETGSAIAQTAFAVPLVFVIPLLIASVTYFQGAFYEPSSRPKFTTPDKLSESYDFIIIGGGSAGKL